MNAQLIVDGCSYELTTMQARAALKAALQLQRGHVRENRDKAAYRLYQMGAKEQSIARVLGITVKGVRGALTRVENGRYGNDAT